MPLMNSVITKFSIAFASCILFASVAMAQTTSTTSSESISDPTESLSNELNDGEEGDEIVCYYIIAWKDENGKHTGKYTKIACHEGEGKKYAEEQAKLISKKRKYAVQSMPVKKGKCALIYIDKLKDGSISFRYDPYLESKSAAEEKARIKKKYGSEILEVLCL